MTTRLPSSGTLPLTRLDLNSSVSTKSDLLWYPSKLFWSGTRVDGVARWNGKTWQTWGRAEGIGKDNKNYRLTLSSMIMTEDDNVWVGLREEGVSRWDGQKWRNYTMNEGLSSEKISVLKTSPDGVLWAGTGDAGINYYNPETDQWIPLPFE